MLTETRFLSVVKPALVRAFSLIRDNGLSEVYLFASGDKIEAVSAKFLVYDNVVFLTLTDHDIVGLSVRDYLMDHFREVYSRYVSSVGGA